MGPATLTMTLNDLRIGQSARITQLNELDCNACRLMEMGLCPGTEVNLVHVAPFGDPIQVEVMGFHVSLRRNEASLVSVELLAG